MQDEMELAADIKSKRDLKWTEGMEYNLVQDEEGVAKVMDLVREAPIAVIDLETSGLNPRKDRVVGLSICVKKGQSFYIPMHHQSGTNAISYQIFCVKYKELLETKPWICHHGKFEWEMFMQTADIDLNVAEDTLIMAYIWDMNAENGLKFCAKHYLKTEMIEIEDLLGKNFSKGTFDVLTPESARVYGCSDAERTFALYEFLIPKMKEFEFIYKVEKGLIKIIGKVELTGIRIDCGMLQKMAEEYTVKIEEARKEVYKEMGVEEGAVELDSPAQVANILFNKMGLPVLNVSKKTKKPSTSKEAMKELEDDYPVVKKIQNYKTMVKIRSTYLIGLQESAENGKIHTSFLPWWFGTGRFASADPNLQNIPKEKHNVRRAFIPCDDYYFEEADYSQIEVRVMASESRSKKLIEAFARGEDIHKATAGLMFGVDSKQINNDQRQAGKKINFGLNYGQTSWGLARELKVPDDVASELMAKYFDRVDGVKQYVATTKMNAHRDGFVKTHFGRKRYLPELFSSNKQERRKGERGAVNTIIQGTAADIMKIAFIKVAKAIAPYGDKVRMLLTVHDSILFEIHKSIRPEVITPVIKAALEFPIAGYVGLVADFKVGMSWGELKQEQEEETVTQHAHAAITEMLEKRSEEDFPCIVITINEPMNHNKITDLKKIFGQAKGDMKVFMLLDGKKTKIPNVMVDGTRDFQLVLRSVFSNEIGLKLYDIAGQEIKPEAVKVKFV